MEGLVIMEILKGMDFEIKNSAVSLGKFDGIHLGHRLLLNEVLGHKELINLASIFSIRNFSIKSSGSIFLVSSLNGNKTVLFMPISSRTIFFSSHE